jgi:hypothetical protein
MKPCLTATALLDSSGLPTAWRRFPFFWLLGKGGGFRKGFFQRAWGKKKRAAKKIGRKGQNNPFLGSFLGDRKKKTKKLGKKNCFAPTKLPKCPFLEHQCFKIFFVVMQMRFGFYGVLLWRTG